MSSVRVIVDGTIDFIPGLSKRDVEVIGLHVFMNDEEVKLRDKDFYSKLSDLNNHFKTAQPSPQDFINAFNKFSNDKIIVITISRKLSGTYNSAVIARKNVNRRDITIIDSDTNSMGIAFMAKACVDAIKAGKGYAIAVKEARKLIGKFRIHMVATTLDYVIRGGRLNKAVGLIGKLVKLKPIVQIRDGVVKSSGKVILFTDLINSFYQFLMNEIKGVKHVYVLHNCMKAEAVKLKQLLSKDFEVSILTNVNRALSVHVGPKCISVGWLEN